MNAQDWPQQQDQSLWSQVSIAEIGLLIMGLVFTLGLIAFFAYLFMRRHDD